MPPAAFSRQYGARLLLMIGNLGFVRWTTAVSRSLHGAPRGNPAPSCVSRCSQRLCGARARLRSFVVVIVIKAANLDEPTSLAHSLARFRLAVLSPSLSPRSIARMSAILCIVSLRPRRPRPTLQRSRQPQYRLLTHHMYERLCLLNRSGESPYREFGATFVRHNLGDIFSEVRASVPSSVYCFVSFTFT